MTPRHALWLAWLPLCACDALLGIEDLKLKPDAGASAVAQSENAASVSDAGELTEPAAGSGGSAGKRSDTPEPRAGTGSKPAPDAGAQQPSAAGQNAPSTNGAAGAKAELLSPVTGTLIDYRRRKLPGVSVRIGDRQTTTDAEGRFTIPDVASRYDVTLLIQTAIRNSAASLVWQFQGLSRRDPTLQVYRALPERDGEVMIHTDNLVFPLPTEQTILVGWSSPDGDFALDISTVDVHYLTPSWSGPAMTTGTAHALLVNAVDGLPTEYLAHDARSLPMTADMQGQVAFDLGGATPSTALVSGTVTGPVLGQRRNEVFLRFRGDDTALQLVNEYDAADNFSYPAPSLPDAKLTVVAKSVLTPGGIAAAYAETDAGGSAVTLELPALPTLVAPDDGKAAVDGKTEFHWNSDAKVFILVARSVDYYDAIYLVTETKQARLPIGAAFGYTPPANAAFEWDVEVHDAYTSIDEASSEAGHLSAYGTDTIRGPRRGAGRFAQSVPRVFTTPP